MTSGPGLDVGAFLVIAALIFVGWLSGAIRRERARDAELFDWGTDVPAEDGWSWEDVVRTRDEINGLPEVHA